jgi:alpha-amylase/alpha-mannosidase (GH57 family)
MWPAEGAVSEAFIAQLGQAGCRWAASGEGVLRASLHRSQIEDTAPAYHPWRLEQVAGVTLFFRDDRLSDLIGFEYSKWHGEKAADHLIGELEGIMARTESSIGDEATPLVCIILDGENAWEHYPYNGYYFFEELYSRLEAHAQIHTTTFKQVLEEGASTSRILPQLSAGSWVYGTLSTWIGDAEKNRAWDLLCSAKAAYDRTIESLDEAGRTAATAQLAICESSDWFWWFGDYNPAPAVASFDRLYRRNLTNLYQLLRIPAPADLEQPISAGSSQATQDGTMRRAQET